MVERAAAAEPSTAVVITGVAASASLGINAESMWRAMLNGQCGMGQMSAIESALPPSSVGGQAAELPADYRPDLPREARYLRWTIEHALTDAGLQTQPRYAATRRCAVLGTTLHGIRAGGRFLRSGDVTQLRSFIASATSQLAFDGLGIDGGVMTTCSACSSSLGAIALGVTLLEAGQADVVVAGGYDAMSEYAWAGFNALRLIAQGPLRPFCRGRQGMKVAEGYGIVILERTDSAVRRGASIKARIAGWGESADAHHLTQPHPQGEGALVAMRQALHRADVKASDLGMIAAHATGTPDNDASEFHALSHLLAERLPRVPIVGFKSFLGHTLGGAGAVELVMSCLALRDQRVPACPNVEPHDVEYPGLFVTTGTPIAHDISSTLNTSLGFGGANTCVVLADPRRAARAGVESAPLLAGPDAWITGVGIVLPGAVGHTAFITQRQHRSSADSRQRLSLLDDAAIADYLNVRRARRLSQYVKFTLAAATMAIRDANLTAHPEQLANANAILGTTHGSAAFCLEYYSQIIAEGALAANPVLFAEGVPNAAAAHLSAGLGLKGACQTIIGSRTAGLDALALAALRVRSGAVDTVVVVAAEAPCDVVDRAYIALGLQSSGAADDVSRKHPGFSRSCGGVAFVVESSRVAAARGAASFARLLDSASASAPTTQFGGPASAVASVLSRLPNPGRVLGSACQTWVDHAERLGIRRAGLSARTSSIHDRFGECFSATPLVGIATELIDSPANAKFTSLCTDWSGATTAMTIEQMDRRLRTL